MAAKVIATVHSLVIVLVLIDLLASPQSRSQQGLSQYSVLAQFFSGEKDEHGWEVPRQPQDKRAKS
jgi:hypothetical protein